MSTFQVTPAGLASAGSRLTAGCADLGAAESSVAQTAAAASGTPAAGANEALVADAQRVLRTLQTAAEDLGRALAQASSNYQAAETTNAACYAPGAGP